jgi:hypothetical protein
MEVMSIEQSGRKSKSHPWDESLDIGTHIPWKSMVKHSVPDLYPAQIWLSGPDRVFGIERTDQ